MKGPGIKDYLQVLYTKKEEAMARGLRYLEVNSKELHAEVSPQHATMPTCCQAIYKVLLEGDAITQSPKGTTGFGSRLTVRYDLENMDARNRMFPSKKRGRPAKTEEEKLAARKARMRRNTEDLCNLIKSWLSEHGWEYIENKDYIEAHNDKERWLINVQGIKRGRKQTLPVKLSEIMKRMDDPATRYSIAFNDSISYRRQWNEIPDSLKKRLKMSVILADKKGNIV
ncbi:MAG: AT hook domain-containing protein, partial [Erysipelotrichaceae bacterium]|nr:AT hook domain-containing protein [Erysipelotrichaceae bacterium]